MNFFLDGELVESLQEMVIAHSCYLSEYINLLNRYINFIKKVSSLKNERQTLIKYVKKLRYLNNYYSFQEKIVVLSDDEQLSDIPLIPIIRRVCSYNVKALEILDLLNFQITQSIKNETISKTLNYSIVFDESFIRIMEETYRVFIKFNQWMFESLEITGCDMGLMDTSLSIELIDIATNCAIDDGINLSTTNDILLQQVEVCETEQDYFVTMNQWVQILKENLQNFNTGAEAMISGFHSIGNSSKGSFTQKSIIAAAAAATSSSSSPLTTSFSANSTPTKPVRGSNATPNSKSNKNVRNTKR